MIWASNLFMMKKETSNLSTNPKPNLDLLSSRKTRMEKCSLLTRMERRKKSSLMKMASNASSMKMDISWL